MANLLQVGLRALQFLWTLLILSLVGNMIASAVGGNPSIVNYCIFTAVFSMLSLVYLFAAAFSESFTVHPVGPLVVDGLNVLFLFCAAVALAAELGAHSCGDDGYTSTNNVTSGSYNNQKRCTEAQASCAFLWFAFASYAASLVLDALTGGGAGTVNLRAGAGGIRKSGPSMSQV